jgi:hypothetical protein
MGNFDQRGQKVKKQTNVAGNQYKAGRDIVHVEGDAVIAGRDALVGNKNEVVVRELQALLRQVQEAAQSGELDADTAVDAEYSLKKATLEAGKEQPDKSKCLEYFDKAKTVIDKAVGVSKSAAALGGALAAAYAKIKGWW